ncbi:MAG: hypothetical protein JWM05_2487 [Acidimicrobiales bacterium]|nr:hypothetical protein [Acidimicrobiales bacterium]
MAPDPEPDDESSAFGAPLPPEDRLWRHPSELGSRGPGAPSHRTDPLSEPWPPLPLPELVGVDPVGVRSRRSGLVAVIAVSCLTGAVIALGVAVATRPTTIVQRPVAQVTLPPARPTIAFGAAPVPAEVIARSLGPTMARIDVRRGTRWISGAAALVDDQGNLLTVATLVAGAGQVIVTFDDGRARRASLTGVDTLTGLAVLHASVPGRHPVAFATSRVSVGEPVALVGGPIATATKGANHSTVSTAIVRATGRLVTTAGTALHDMLQIDRDVLADSSGGVLTNRQGEVVGVAIADQPGDGVGYVVPGDVAEQVAGSLVADGTVHRAWLGVQAVDLDPPSASELDVTGGARVTHVTRGGPAATAGVRVGDVIVAMDARRIGSASDVVVALRSMSAGQRTRIEVLRTGRRRQLAAALSGT